MKHDSLTAFMQDTKLVPGTLGRYWSSELYTLYQIYCQDKRYDAATRQAFINRLRNNGITTIGSHGSHGHIIDHVVYAEIQLWE